MSRVSKLAIVFLSIAVSAFGQAARTATLVGNVTDPGAAIVVGAKVMVMNTETSVVSTGTSNHEGAYYIPFLPVGKYQLTIEAPGFKKFVQRGIELQAGDI